MKIVISLLSMLLSVACAPPGEKSYTASTPAAPIIKSFLGIPLTDSIDFIRWQITFSGNHYSLHCNYGIGKPNTNGFINGGGKVDLEGGLKIEKNIYQLRNGDKILKMVELNDDLLHFVNPDNSLMIGNGGWSYAINNLSPSVTDQLNGTLQAKQTNLKDSMAFEGRTPCGVPGIIAPGALCYKLKWYVVFYADKSNNQPLITFSELHTGKKAAKKETGKLSKDRMTESFTSYTMTQEKYSSIFSNWTRIFLYLPTQRETSLWVMKILAIP